MLPLLKKAWQSDTGFLYVPLAIQCVLLVLSTADAAPWLNPRTTFGRLYGHPAVNIALIAVLAFGMAGLKLSPPERRRTMALVFAGLLLGIGLASAFAFDAGVFMMLSFGAGNLFRANRLPAPPR